MNIISNILLNDRQIKRNTYIWNSLSTCMNSFQTMLLLVVLTRIGTPNDSGIFVMAYAVGNLLYNFGKFGVRQFQVTDQKEKYLFDDYLSARIMSTIMMILAMIIYIGYNSYFSGYSRKKIIVVALICIYKGIEAFEDVLHGRMQQKGRLDVVGRIWGTRLFVFIVGYAGVFIATKDIVITTAISVFVTAVLCLILNASVIRNFCDEETKLFKAGNRWKMLLMESFPLFLSMLLGMYLNNAPKYTIDEKVSDAVQTNFNIVFMPVFVVSLLSSFIFQPSLIKMGILWKDKKIRELKKLVSRLIFIPVVVDIICTVAAGLLGIPILSVIYGVDLSDFKLILLIFMLSSGVIAVMNLLIMILTTMRKQKLLLLGFCVTSAMMALFSGRVLSIYGLLGLSLYFEVILILMDIYCYLVYMFGVKS